MENFSTSTGQATNAVFGFTSMLINMLRDEKPTHIVVAFDVSRQSFRNEHYAEYKANRRESPDEFAGQVELVKEVLAALRIPTAENPRPARAPSSSARAEGSARQRAVALLASEPDLPGNELARRLGVTTGYGRRLRSELLNAANGYR